MALARKSRADNGLVQRVELRHFDFRAAEALAPHETFDLITGSPPYFGLDQGITSSHDQKLHCRFEVRGDVTDYMRVGAAHLAPGGVMALVFPVRPAHQLERVIKGAREAGLLVLRRQDVVLKEGEPALLGLFLLGRATDFPPAWSHGFERGEYFQDDALVIRKKDGSVTTQYSLFKMEIGFPP